MAVVRNGPAEMLANKLNATPTLWLYVFHHFPVKIIEFVIRKFTRGAVVHLLSLSPTFRAIPS